MQPHDFPSRTLKAGHHHFHQTSREPVSALITALLAPTLPVAPALATPRDVELTSSRRRPFRPLFQGLSDYVVAGLRRGLAPIGRNRR